MKITQLRKDTLRVSDASFEERLMIRRLLGDDAVREINMEGSPSVIISSESQSVIARSLRALGYTPSKDGKDVVMTKKV